MKYKKDSLGDRMKKYETVSQSNFTNRLPLVIRLDGKAFHSFTRGLKKPYDPILMATMQKTMKYLCANIQGCVLGYTQSDEISLILVDYQSINSSAWFDKNLQKVVSVSASMATLAFNKTFGDLVRSYKHTIAEQADYLDNEYEKYSPSLNAAMVKGAMFDSRAFVLPAHEVVNYLIWRQQDATRNSIQSAGRKYFSEKQLFKKNTSEIQDLLMLEKGINWNNYPIEFKRGSCCKRVEVQINGQNDVLRHRWIVDREIPVFTQDREYINDLVIVGASSSSEKEGSIGHLE